MAGDRIDCFIELRQLIDRRHRRVADRQVDRLFDGRNRYVRRLGARAADLGDQLRFEVDHRRAARAKATQEITEADDVLAFTKPIDDWGISDPPAVLEQSVAVLEIEDRWKFDGLTLGFRQGREPDNRVAEQVSEHGAAVQQLQVAIDFSRRSGRNTHHLAPWEHEIDKSVGQTVIFQPEPEVVRRLHRQDRRDEVDLAVENLGLDDRSQLVVIDKDGIDQERQTGECRNRCNEPPGEQLPHDRQRSVASPAIDGTCALSQPSTADVAARCAAATIASSASSV